MKNKGADKPIVVMVGNKCDLEDKRKVETAEIDKLAKMWGVSYLEASALEKINVKETFLTIAKKMLRKRINLDKVIGDEKKKRCFCF